MRFLFCSDLWNPCLPDPAYEAEVAVVKKPGMDCSLIDFEPLTEQRNPQRAVRKVEPITSQKELAIYRGWMLKPDVYTLLHEALAEKNVFLINTSEAYKHCHYLPESYSVINAHTPASIWLRLGPTFEMHAFGVPVLEIVFTFFILFVRSTKSMKNVKTISKNCFRQRSCTILPAHSSPKRF